MNAPPRRIEKGVGGMSGGFTFSMAARHVT